MNAVAWIALLVAGAHPRPPAPLAARLLEASWILSTVDSSAFVDRGHAAELADALARVRAGYPDVAAIRQQGLDLKVAIWVKPESLSWAAALPKYTGRDTTVRTLHVASLDRLGRDLGVLDYRVMNFHGGGIVVTPRFPRIPAFIGMAARYRSNGAVSRVSANHDIAGSTTAIFVSRTASLLLLTLWDGTHRGPDGAIDIVSHRFSYDRRTHAVRRLES